MTNINKINDLITSGHIKKTGHTTADLFIFNYTEKTQFEELWCEETLACRGLIMDAEDNIISRPFKKFFNVDQQKGGIPTSNNFKVYEKLDGSLGITYWLNNKPYLATRDSFTSEQAQVGTKMLQSNSELIASLNPNYTYLFEIIYPENRIVVNYKGRKELILLGVIETATGQELDIYKLDLPVSKAKIFNGLRDFKAIQDMDNNTDEGFVILFEDGLRLKYKFERYKQLHKFQSGFSPRSVWESLKDGQSLDKLLEITPDEMYDEVKAVVAELESRFLVSMLEVQMVFSNIDKSLDRKSQAQFIMTNHKSLAAKLFNLLDSKNINQLIWNDIKPAISL